MDARALLSDLRRGIPPTPEALAWVAGALADGTLTDAQAGAFAMGICHVGLDEARRVALTRAMRDTGDILRWDLPAPVIDKHSTGGIGDCASIVLAPALAASGVYCPMISGRGLGHTGGTLDKLEAVPGVVTEVTPDRFHQITAEAGCAIVSASSRIAPADKRLYAIRDVTGTVASIDLIVSSILSKKMAGGAGILVFDVKMGSGAFLPDAAATRALAEALVATARGAGIAASALLTDMNQPVAPAVGNAVEMREVLATLDGAPGPLADLTVALGAECLALAGIPDGEGTLRAVLASGAAMERYERMISALGGTPGATLPQAPVVRPVPAPRAGVVAAIDGTALGMAVVRLGGGRLRDGDRVDPAVGLSEVLRLGTPVGKGDALALVHAGSAAAADAAVAAVSAGMTVADCTDLPPLVHERI